MRILLTNDDSHDSPLLHLAIDYCRKLGDLTLVVPAEEQSWKGKSMSPERELQVVETEIAGHSAFVVSGTPADCANIGIYHLMDEKPDLVISGINMGRNTGISYIWGSGTVGACLEGNIAGIPGVAISQSLNQETYERWRNERSICPEVLECLKDQLKKALDGFFVSYFQRDESRTAVTLSINAPFQLADDWRLEAGYVGHSYYASAFERSSANAFRSKISNFPTDPREQADTEIINRGNVSVSLCDMHAFGQKLLNFEVNDGT